MPWLFIPTSGEHGTSLNFPLIGSRSVLIWERNRAQDLFILWFMVLALSGWGRGESRQGGAQSQMTQLREAEWECDQGIAPVRSPALSALNKSWNEDEVASPWNLTGLPCSPVLWLSISQREHWPGNSTGPLVVLSPGGERVDPSPSPGPSQA